MQSKWFKPEHLFFLEEYIVIRENDIPTSLLAFVGEHQKAIYRNITRETLPCSVNVTCQDNSLVNK